MQCTPNHRELLALSLVAYRGNRRLLGDGNSKNDVTSSVEQALARVAPLRGRWRLAWGVASYRPPISIFDDAAMFVAADMDKPGRYAVVVRGTNAISLTDWIFGDLWTDRCMLWPYGREPGQAQISLSTS